MSTSAFARSPEFNVESQPSGDASFAAQALLSQSRELVKIVSNPDGSSTRMVQEPDGKGGLRVTVLEKASADGSVREAYSFRYDAGGSLDYFTHTSSRSGFYRREQWARESKYGWHQVDVFHKESDAEGRVVNMHHVRQGKNGRSQCLSWIKNGSEGVGDPPSLAATHMTIVPRADRTITITGYVGTQEDNCPENCRTVIRF